MNRVMSQIKVKKLFSKSNNLGKIMRIMRESDEYFKKFGEVYVTSIKANLFKGWKKHKLNTTNLVVLIGKVKIIIFDKNLEKEEFHILDCSSSKLIIIPPGHWFGMKNLSNRESLILNFSDYEHNPNEVISKDIGFINSKNI
tara:strand:- start:10 stop:435 length:426 start_codon:yes stop_codon:yes gene_type:complete